MKEKLEVAEDYENEEDEQQLTCDLKMLILFREASMQQLSGKS